MTPEHGPSFDRRKLLKTAGVLGLSAVFIRPNETKAEDIGATVGTKVELSSYTGELYPSPTYPYSIILPEDMEAIPPYKGIDGTIIDKYIGLKVPPDGQITEIEIMPSLSVDSHKTLEDIRDELLEELEAKGGKSIGWTNPGDSIIDGNLPAVEIQAKMRIDNTDTYFERRDFLFQKNDNLWIARGKYTTDPSMTGDEYLKFSEMMTQTFRFTTPNLA